MELPFELETDLERAITAHPRWQSGIEWGRPRHGHPEGSVKLHVVAVLSNIDRMFGDDRLRADLRLIALLHDSFKAEVDYGVSRTGENHHGVRARRFAESYIADENVLAVVELHDEAFNAWQCGNRDGRWEVADARARALLARIGPARDLYLKFYRCDNETEGKDPACFEWFRTIASNDGPA